MSQYYHKYAKYKTKYNQLMATNPNNDLVNIINNNFQKILRGYQNPKYHLFFESHDWFLKATSYWEKQIKDKYKNYEYDNTKLNIEAVDECKYIPKKTISDKLL